MGTKVKSYQEILATVESDNPDVVQMARTLANLELEERRHYLCGIALNSHEYLIKYGVNSNAEHIEKLRVLFWPDEQEKYGMPHKPLSYPLTDGTDPLLGKDWDELRYHVKKAVYLFYPLMELSTEDNFGHQEDGGTAHTYMGNVQRLEVIKELHETLFGPLKYPEELSYEEAPERPPIEKYIKEQK